MHAALLGMNLRSCFAVMVTAFDNGDVQCALVTVVAFDMTDSSGYYLNGTHGRLSDRLRTLSALKEVADQIVYRPIRSAAPNVLFAAPQPLANNATVPSLLVPNTKLPLAMDFLMLITASKRSSPLLLHVVIYLNTCFQTANSHTVRAPARQCLPWVQGCR